MPINMRYADIYKFDISNGPGIRVSVFFQGCDKHCPGCFNPETWDFNTGREFNSETISEVLRLAENEWISGLSILGGEPLHPNNIGWTAQLCAAFKKKYPEKTIWIWTGYTWEELGERYMSGKRPDKTEIAYLLYGDVIVGRDSVCDVLIDGPFIEAKKDLSLPWRGSSNQRIWMKNENGELYDASNNFR